MAMPAFRRYLEPAVPALSRETGRHQPNQAGGILLLRGAAVPARESEAMQCGAAARFEVGLLPHPASDIVEPPWCEARTVLLLRAGS